MNRTPNKEAIRTWVEALRSGRYEQAVGALRDDADRYCCLGVACDVSGIGAWADTPTEAAGLGRNAYRYTPVRGNPTSEIAALPPAVMEHYGLDSDDPRFVGRDPKTGEWCSRDAWTWNDSSGASFAQIADMIEHTFLRERRGA